ncbi:MAG: hypothetical protein DI538_29000, partial [Azospira oryzae]
SIPKQDTIEADQFWTNLYVYYNKLDKIAKLYIWLPKFLQPPAKSFVLKHWPKLLYIYRIFRGKTYYKLLTA